MYYVPKFVKQVSDLEYGSVVTHENYNEKLNLNAEQGDYNTEVLRILFTERDINNTYRIPYLEKYTDDAVAKIQNEIDEHIEQIDKNTQGIKDNKALILNNAMDIDYIIDGRTPVALAKYANKVDGIDTAADHTYYGKDYDGKIGFHAVPDGIFAEDISSSTAEINGIYYVPRADSVEEYMLTSDVIAKLNRSSITAYPDLTDKPQINDVILIGNLTLNDLGIQPAGRYLTEVPEEYAKSVDIANTYITKTDAATDYTPIGLYTDLKNSVDSLNDDINALPYNRVYIGEAPAEAKTGDLLVDL
jgi:hypothetical protein